MLLSDVVATSAAVAGVSGRLDKTARLAELLGRLSRDGPADVEAGVAFLTGSTRQGRIGVGYRAIAAASDRMPADSPSLTVADVDATFGAVATMQGAGSARARVAALGDVFTRATREEQDFLRRLLYGELRQGALEGVLIDAIARAAAIAPARVRRAAMLAGALEPVAVAALTQGEAALDAFAIRVMSPVLPMLADSDESVAGALSRLGDASIELKLDGARVQVHKLGDDVRVYSRTLNDVTASAPEIVSLVQTMPARELILDGEVLALRDDGRPHPFQVTMRRFGRTRDIERARAELPLTPVFFDVLLADGTSLLDDPLEARTRILHDLAGGAAVPRLMRPTLAAAEAFADDAIARGHEGVMAKALDAPYAAGRRGATWLKIKRARTLDLVVLAVEWGSGRRQGWLSNLHLGARDPATGTFVMLGKTFKGMTDDLLAWQTDALLALETGRDGHVVYVRPELVVEIAFNEIQTSPIYPGGLALRFARVKRYRPDKTAADADTIDTVRTMALC